MTARENNYLSRHRVIITSAPQWGLLLQELLEKGSVHRPWFSQCATHLTGRTRGRQWNFIFLCKHKVYAQTWRERLYFFLFAREIVIFYTHTLSQNSPAGPLAFLPTPHPSSANCLAPDKSPGGLHKIISETVVNPFLDISLTFFLAATREINKSRAWRNRC